MAAHKTVFSPRVQEEIRARIRSTLLVKRLEQFALSERDPKNNEGNNKPVHMTPAQVNAALGLLRKTLPDLSNIEMSGESGGPLVVQVVRFGDAVAADPGSASDG